MDSETIRLDKWLWFARVAKSRTLAQKLVSGGRVRVNRNKIHSPGRAVRQGDVLTINLPERVLVFEVVALGVRRGPYSEARQLYLDHSQPINSSSGNAAVKPAADPAATQGRPDRRQRKALANLRGKII